MYYQLFSQMKKTLLQLDACLDKAVAHAQSKNFDSAVLATSRLAPDQFPLARQVQIACDTAKLAASRLTGKDAPSQPDTEQTIDELRARIRSATDYLDGFSSKDYENAADAVVSQPRWEGKTMSGADYFREHALPNFFFHVTHVYAILRHNGVPLGKRDYLGTMNYQPAQ